MLNIRLLGEQSVVDDGTSVTAASSSRALMLLAQLVLHPGQTLSRGQLAGLFWPDSSDEQALTNLRRELHNLRRALPASDRCLVTETRTLLWVPDDQVDCDVTTFQRAAHAAELAAQAQDNDALRDAATEAVNVYRGDLLPAIYEEWVLVERDRLRLRCVDLLDELVRQAQEAEDSGAGVEFARRRVELETLDDAGYRTLMEFQAQAGNRAAALNTYHRCASLLERELGVSPDPMTTALYEELVAEGTAARAESPTSSARSLSIRQLPMVGRKEQTDELRQRWSQARAGHPGLHVVVGEAGVGKSRLIDDVAREAERGGAVVARARCYAGAARLAMAPVAEWLASDTLRRQRDSLDQVWAAEVERLVPSTSAQRERPQPMVDAWQRHRFFEGLARAVLATSRPTLLLLDDIQWCDADTLTWIQMLFRLAADQPLLVLATNRLTDAEDNQPLAEALRALGRDGLMTTTELEPLSDEETAELATLLGVDAASAAAMYAATGGYPLFVIESSRAGPTATGDGASVGQQPRVRAVLADRLEQLGPDARDVVNLAAVVGRDFSLELLAEASDLPLDSVVTAIDELWRRRIITQHRRSTYDFVHDLLRDAALSEVTPPRRMLLDRRIAQALELLHSDDLASYAAAIANHYDHAQLTARAVSFHVLAAETAVGLFANADAVRHYQRAAELVESLPASSERDRLEMEIRMAMSAPVTALYSYASTLLQGELERAAALAERLNEDRLHALTLVGLFAARFVQGHTRESYEIGLRALAISQSYPDVVGQAHFAVAGGASSLGLLSEAIEHFDVVAELTMPYPPMLVGTRPEVHARAWSAHAYWLIGRGQEAEHWSSWALERAEAVDHPYSVAVALAYAAMHAQFCGDQEAARDLGEQTTRICHRHDFAYYGNWGEIIHGWAIGGDEGIEVIERSLQRLDTLGVQARRPYFLWLLADCLIRLDRPEPARRLLDQATGRARQADDVWWLPELLRVRAGLSDGIARQRFLDQALSVAAAHGSAQLARRAVADGARTVSERSPA
jgi:DNA-binding SARP family transcriptional activator/tetratricopeptide (TPR) repeat protein